ncbi:cyclase family protein [Flammeovirgaceae bacterium SG7u.111]|nr:cyclase family protein [Flammeovirgaceae bacterium SG7u.132]WPO37549.1 cyclase family protein [Flammeovirgaceae bacterium SG7u.111]
MKEIIDLTLTYHPGMPGVAFDTARTLTEDGWNAKTLHLYSHSGTHMDAPLHFGVSPLTIDRLPVESCMGKAWLVDIPNCGSSQLIRVEDLEKAASQAKKDDILLFRTGWSKYIDDLEVYRNLLPRISEELANWIVDTGIKLIGVEPPSVADVNNLPEVTKIHEILLGGNVVIVEGLCNLDKITSESVQFMALPLKIMEGDGAPCRAIAWEKEGLTAE